MDFRLTSRPGADSELIFEIIREALQPFQCKKVKMEVVERHGIRLLVIEVDVLPRHILKVPIDENLFTAFPKNIAVEILAVKIADYFANIRIPVDDHIHLGRE